MLWQVQEIVPLWASTVVPVWGRGGEGEGTLLLTAVGATSVLPGVHPEAHLGVLDKKHVLTLDFTQTEAVQ